MWISPRLVRFCEGHIQRIWPGRILHVQDMFGTCWKRKHSASCMASSRRGYEKRWSSILPRLRASTRYLWNSLRHKRPRLWHRSNLSEIWPSWQCHTSHGPLSPPFSADLCHAQLVERFFGKKMGSQTLWRWPHSPRVVRYAHAGDHHLGSPSVAPEKLPWNL